MAQKLHHQEFIDIDAVDHQRPPLGPVRLEAQAPVEVDGVVVVDGDREVDLLNPCSGMVENSVYHRFGKAAAPAAFPDIDAPENALVHLLSPVLGTDKPAMASSWSSTNPPAM